jgi:hypothetical protein
MINNNLKQLVETITDFSTELCFSGSFALNHVGLLERDCGDLDLVTDNSKLFHEINNYIFEEIPYVDWYLGKYKKKNQSIFLDNVNGKGIKRKELEINGNSVCLFLIRDLSYFETKYGEEVIRMQNIMDVLMIKAAYAKLDPPQGIKHKDDLNHIQAKLDSSVKTEALGTKPLIKTLELNDLPF